MGPSAMADGLELVEQWMGDICSGRYGWRFLMFWSGMVYQGFVRSYERLNASKVLHLHNPTPAFHWDWTRTDGTVDG